MESLSRMIVAILVLMVFSSNARAESEGCKLPSAGYPLAASEISKGSLDRPLAPEERVLVDLRSAEDLEIEVRYHVDGRHYLTERIVPPDWASAAGGSTKAPRSFEPSRKHDNVPVVELLAFDPEIVRELHQLTEAGSSIEVEVFEQGRSELLTWSAVRERSAALRAQPVSPVAVQSVVELVEGRSGTRYESVFQSSYPDCEDVCTESASCATECGWDPGKGGPVTCGEQGLPCEGWSPPGCACETVQEEYWGDWYMTWYMDYTPHSHICYYYGNVQTPWWTLRWAQIQERRDLHRRVRVCPGCPNCFGCYDEVRVVGNQYRTRNCYRPLQPGCSGYPQYGLYPYYPPPQPACQPFAF